MRKFPIFSFQKMQLSNRNIARKSHFYNITMCFDDIDSMLQARKNILKAKKIGLFRPNNYSDIFNKIKM